MDTTFLERSVLALEKGIELLQKSPADDVTYDLYRSACIKEFEIIVEQSEKLPKKSLRPYFATPKQLDQLFFKDIFSDRS